MYAIIKSGSRQYQVRPESSIEVNRLPLEEGAPFETDQVLLVDQEGQDIQIGSPYVSGAKVKGKVLSHLRGRKVIVFKFKRRKNYKRTRGHRQELTQVLIEGIEIGGKAMGAKKPAAAMAEEKVTEKAAEKIAVEKTPPKQTSDKGKSTSETIDKTAAPKTAKTPPAKQAADKGDTKTKAAAPKDKAAPNPPKAAKEKTAAKDEN